MLCLFYNFIRVSIIFFLSINFAKCYSTNEISNEGVVFFKTQFFDSLGRVRFADTISVWYKDSMAIEKINQINIIREPGGHRKINYSLLAFRYIDLPSNSWYDYRNLSDTAKAIKKGQLPDSVFMDYGWCFYSNKTIQIQGQPEFLHDTIIENIAFKRAKLDLIGQNPERNFAIGYFKCDNLNSYGNIFSLEKLFSKKLNCIMTKIFNFQKGKLTPYASMEIIFISESLTTKELDVFKAWKKNIKEYPVNK